MYGRRRRRAQWRDVEVVSTYPSISHKFTRDSKLLPSRLRTCPGHAHLSLGLGRSGIPTLRKFRYQSGDFEFATTKKTKYEKDPTLGCSFFLGSSARHQPAFEITNFSDAKLVIVPRIIGASKPDKIASTNVIEKSESLLFEFNRIRYGFTNPDFKLLLKKKNSRFIARILKMSAGQGQSVVSYACPPSGRMHKKIPIAAPSGNLRPSVRPSAPAAPHNPFLRQHPHFALIRADCQLPSCPAAVLRN